MTMGWKGVFRASLLVVAMLVVAASSAHAGLERVRELPVQHEGQVVSFESFSRKTLGLIAEKGTLDRQPAWRVMLDAVAAGEAVIEKQWIRIRYSKLRELLGLPEGQPFYSYSEVAPSIQKIVQLARSGKSKRDQDLRPSFLEQKAESLYGKMIAVQNIASGEALNVVPHSGDETWFPAEVAGANAAKQFGLLLDAARRKDEAAFDWQATQWIQGVHQKTEFRYANKMHLEVWYYKLQAFHFSAFLYIAAFVAFAFFRTRWVMVFAVAAASTAFLLHTSGLVLRIVILERPPVSNMFESVIFMNWVVMLAAGIYAIVVRRSAIASAGCLLSGAVMIYSDLLPLDSGLGVLVPVLRSNYWLSVHVMTIVSSYGLFGLAMALGHRHLVLWYRGKLSVAEDRNSENAMTRSIQIGTLLLGVGTVLGGVWANESWGRFWGWDPKETWALITFLGYLIIIHLQYRNMLSSFGLAIGSVIGFLLVLMTWYGVNFVLGRGLHSYGQGSGGAEWIIYYLVAESIFLAVVLFKKAQLQKRTL